MPPTANAGPDRTCYVNEVIALDGSGSSGAYDALQVNGRHSIQWDFGQGWTYEGGLIAPIAFPKAGVYPVTLTLYDSGGASHSDTCQVTVSDIVEGTETFVHDSGNAITNASNLVAEIAARAGHNNPVITLDAGVTYDFDGINFDLPNRTGAGYCTIRTSAYASLPNGQTRVGPSDAANMPILTPGDHPADSGQNSAAAVFTAPAGSTPAHHYRLLGLCFKKKFPALDYTNPRAFVDLGNGTPSAVAQLPHHIQADRCLFDGGDNTHQTQRAFALQVTDSAVVNCYIYKIKSFSADVQTIWIGMGERIAVINNYLSASTENMLSGGNDATIYLEQATAQASGTDATHIKLAASASAVNDFYKGKGLFIQSGTGSTNMGVVITAYDGTTKIATIDPGWFKLSDATPGSTPDGTSVYRIGDHVPTDVVVRRNHMQKDVGWHATDPSYYGVNFSVKNIFEVKQGMRWSVEGNRFEDHWQEDQNWAITLTAKNQDGRQPWSKLSYIDFAYNKVLKVGNGFQILVSDWFYPSTTSDHILIRHNVIAGVGKYDPTGFQNLAVLQDAGSKSVSPIGDRVIFVRNSSDHNGTSGKGRAMQFETTTKFRNFVLYGNICQGYFTQDGPTGSAALAAGTGGGAGSYSATKNGWHTPTGTNPSDNTTVTDLAAVKFTDVANYNLKLASDSPFLTTGPNGGRAGADTDQVDVMTAGAVSGVWSDSGGGGGGPTEKLIAICM